MKDENDRRGGGSRTTGRSSGEGEIPAVEEEHDDGAVARDLFYAMHAGKGGASPIPPPTAKAADDAEEFASAPASPKARTDRDPPKEEKGEEPTKFEKRGDGLLLSSSEDKERSPIAAAAAEGGGGGGRRRRRPGSSSSSFEDDDGEEDTSSEYSERISADAVVNRPDGGRRRRPAAGDNERTSATTETATTHPSRVGAIAMPGGDLGAAGEEGGGSGDGGRNNSNGSIRVDDAFVPDAEVGAAGVRRVSGRRRASRASTSMLRAGSHASMTQATTVHSVPDEAVVALGMNDDENENGQKNKKSGGSACGACAGGERRRRIVAAAVAIVVVLIAAIIAAVLVTRNNGGGPANDEKAIQQKQQQEEEDRDRAERALVVRLAALSVSGPEASTSDAEEDPDTPRGRAVSWMVDEDDETAALLRNYNEGHMSVEALQDRLAQRYAASVLLFSSIPGDADFHLEELMASGHECGWNAEPTAFQWGLRGGFSCDDDDVDDADADSNSSDFPDAVTSIYFGKQFRPLEGTFPREIGHFAKLRNLVLGINPGLTGTVPPDVSGNLGSLEKVILGTNEGLTGPMPWFESSASTLRTMIVNLCGFDGTIPGDVVRSMTNLSLLLLVNIDLSGTFPEELSALPNLSFLALVGSRIGGTIPASLGRNQSLLSGLALFGNDLTGPFPSGILTDPDLGGPESLIALYLNDNQFTGTIPAELGKLTDLEALFLSSNDFTGTVPPQVGNLTNLKSLELRDNRLSGSVPTSLANLAPNLESLSVLGNDALAADLDFLCPDDGTGGTGNANEEGGNDEEAAAAFRANVVASCPRKDPNVQCECCECCSEEGLGATCGMSPSSMQHAQALIFRECCGKGRCGVASCTHT